MDLPDTIATRRLQVDADTLDRAQWALFPEERSRMRTFRSEERRDSFAVGRLAARELIAARLGCPVTEVAIEVLEDGSLAVPGTGLHVSISHSDREVVAAVSADPVGIDIEAVRPRPVSLYRFMLHQAEVDLPDRLDMSGDERLALIWSIKEAVLKGRRSGLRHSPKRLRIDPTGLPDAALVISDDAEPWHVVVERADGYVSAVAWPSELSLAGQPGDPQSR
jgi:4'-phosphopantetheinyl transferase